VQCRGQPLIQGYRQRPMISCVCGVRDVKKPREKKRSYRDKVARRQAEMAQEKRLRRVRAEERRTIARVRRAAAAIEGAHALAAPGTGGAGAGRATLALLPIRPSRLERPGIPVAKPDQVIEASIGQSRCRSGSHRSSPAIAFGCLAASWVGIALLTGGITISPMLGLLWTPREPIAAVAGHFTVLNDVGELPEIGDRLPHGGRFEAEAVENRSQALHSPSGIKEAALVGGSGVVVVPGVGDPASATAGPELGLPNVAVRGLPDSIARAVRVSAEANAGRIPGHEAASCFAAGAMHEGSIDLTRQSAAYYVERLRPVGWAVVRFAAGTPSGVLDKATKMGSETPVVRAAFRLPAGRVESRANSEGGRVPGELLAEAAERQARRLTVYDDSYRDLAFPGGDVPIFYGVCTDVLIRAYRQFGIDLQANVARAGLAQPDTSIAHRRVQVLLTFFERHAEKLPGSQFAGDYAPGDIVVYRRSMQAGGRYHIALVSRRSGASGAPMIVHNRGWGVQIEDALFADPIIGHFRYTGLERPGVDAPGRDKGAASAWLLPVRNELRTSGRGEPG